MFNRRGPGSVWSGVAVRVTSRLVSRYAWTTVSIDVWIDGDRVLSSGGALQFTGKHIQSFHFGKATHEAKLTWGTSWLRSFPFKLEIDGALVDESRVVIENWWLGFWPLIMAIGFTFVRQAFHH